MTIERLTISFGTFYSLTYLALRHPMLLPPPPPLAFHEIGFLSSILGYVILPRAADAASTAVQRDAGNFRRWVYEWLNVTRFG